MYLVVSAFTMNHVVAWKTSGLYTTYRERFDLFKQVTSVHLTPFYVMVFRALSARVHEM